MTDDASHSASISAAKITATLAGTDPGEATCAGLATSATGGGEDGPSLFTTTIAWTSSTTGFKVAPTTVTAELGILSDTHGNGFALDANADNADDGTSVAGSLSGGDSASKAYVDSTSQNALLLALANAHATFADPTATLGIAASNPCEPTMKIKSAVAGDLVGDAISVKVSKPKSLKKILVGNSGAIQGCVDPCIPADSSLSVHHA